VDVIDETEIRRMKPRPLGGLAPVDGAEPTPTREPADRFPFKSEMLVGLLSLDSLLAVNMRLEKVSLFKADDDDAVRGLVGMLLRPLPMVRGLVGMLLRPLPMDTPLPTETPSSERS
jgi:hypothetical protein